MIKFLKNLIYSILLYGLILYLINQYSNGWFLIEATQYSELVTFVVLAFFFWVVNNIVKFFLKILTIPLRYLTLGLFSLILNMLMIYVFEYLVNNSNIGVFVYLGTMVQVFIMSLVIAVSSFLIKKII